MTSLADDKTYAEFAAYARVVATADCQASFVAAFSALVEFIVACEHCPYHVVAGFLCGMIKGRGMVDDPPLNEFVEAFAAFAKDAVTRDVDPHVTIGTAAWRMIEGSHEAIAEVLNYRRVGGTA